MDRGGGREVAGERVDIRAGPFVEYLLVPEAFNRRSFAGDPYFIAATTSLSGDRLTRKLSISGYVACPNVYLFECNDVHSAKCFSDRRYDIADYCLPVHLRFAR